MIYFFIFFFCIALPCQTEKKNHGDEALLCSRDEVSHYEKRRLLPL